MRLGGGRGRGVTALFAGDSGTGKTMSAEVIAGELGLDLYTVNLATVVDKYVGRPRRPGTDLLRGRRGQRGPAVRRGRRDLRQAQRVRDAHDRYANIESAYLLQRMETFDGLAILATNLRSNIDDAFTHRLDMIIDFPAPDERSRLSIWQHCLRPPVPVEDGLDLEFCARSFTMSGGNIRSAATTAGYLAAGADKSIGMAELIAAIAASTARWAGWSWNGVRALRPSCPRPGCRLDDDPVERFLTHGVGPDTRRDRRPYRGGMSDSPVGPYQETRTPGIRRAVQEFYERDRRRPVAGRILRRPYDMDRLRRHVVELLAAAVGGPGQYTGRTMAKAHQGLHITDEAFDRVLGHLNAALVDVGADDRTIREVLRALSGMRMDIVQE